jgi:hypothetical protein
LPDGLPRTASGKPDGPALKKLAAQQEGYGSDASVTTPDVSADDTPRPSSSAPSTTTTPSTTTPPPTTATLQPTATVQPPTTATTSPTATAPPAVSSSAVLGDETRDALGSRRWEVDLSSKDWRFATDHTYRDEVAPQCLEPWPLPYAVDGRAIECMRWQALFPGSGYVALAAEVCAP